LAEVQRTSSAQNQAAAFAFFDELKRRKAGEVGESLASDATPSAAAEDDGGADSKPVFRRPVQHKEGDGAGKSAAKRHADSAPGTVIAEDCLVGVKHRRRGTPDSSRPRQPADAGEPAAKRRRAPTGLSFGEEEA